MMQKMYLWYLDNLDEVPFEILSVVFEEYSDAHERYAPSIFEPGSSQLDTYSRVMNSPIFYWHEDYTGPQTWRSKWERIGKPFIEDMVAFNAKIHFWNPAGGVLRKIHALMLVNEDWDDPSSWIE